MKFVILALALIGAASAVYVAPGYSTPIIGGAIHAPAVAAPIAYSAPAIAPIAPALHGGYVAPALGGYGAAGFPIWKKKAAA
ncbi:unnamed protein product [Hermetia illucens]|uniref:Uncharacterized protein n=1 Tax=Hermetia illucens TaxID=343691 RepID=A0A7R8YTE6_HERIL|nr:unnamed protein product [Hermetia illucens]